MDHRKFSELRSGLSPEAQERSQARTAEMLGEMSPDGPDSTEWKFEPWIEDLLAREDPFTAKEAAIAKGTGYGPDLMVSLRKNAKLRVEVVGQVENSRQKLYRLHRRSTLIQDYPDRSTQ